MKTYDGWTNKFIFPPYDFTVATNLVTNFHMPLSTMLMMVAAFGGYDIVLEAYESALKEGYRFGAYGDAMLIFVKSIGYFYNRENSVFYAFPPFVFDERSQIPG